MGLFSKFKKQSETPSHQRSAELTVVSHTKLTDKAARISFAVPEELKDAFAFKAGQYLNLHCPVNGALLNRSYSICSGKNEPLSVAVKAIENGAASNWLVNSLKEGDTLQVDFPTGNFAIDQTATQHVAFAAGSGITPILAMAKSLEGTNSELTLFYSNSSQSETLFADELNALKNTKTHYYFSREQVEGSGHGRFNKETVAAIIKEQLPILRAGAFYICGPEEMILGTKETLELFGAKPSTIHFELFTTPVLMVQESVEEEGAFSGESKVTAILDGEVTSIQLSTDGKTILDALDGAGMDVPFSCKGGVCCTCRAKIIEGSAKMKINYALTDDEVKEGFILTCQSHPTSPVLKLDFDV